MRQQLYEMIELISGLIFIFLGIIMLMGPIDAINNYKLSFGISSILKGISHLLFFNIIDDMTQDKTTSAFLIGAVNILAGIFFILTIWMEAAQEISWFAIWVMVLCITKILMISYLRIISKTNYLWNIFIVNILGIIFCLLMINSRCIPGMLPGYCISGYFIARGINVISFIFKYSQNKDGITYQ